VQFDNSSSQGTVNIGNGDVLPGGVSFNNDAGHPYTLTGLNGIGGTGQMVKNGAGSLTIDTLNSYTGGTNILAGTLNASAGSALGTGAVTINGGTLNSNFAEAVASTMLNSGLLVVNDNLAAGAATLILAGGTIDTTVPGGVTLGNNAQTWNGDFTFKGTQNLSMANAAVTLGSSRTVTANAGTLTVNGVISGATYSLTLAGHGLLALGAANTYSGATTVNGGTMQLNYTGNNATGALTSPTITVNAGAFLALNANDVIGYTVGREVPFINDGIMSNITPANRVTFQNTVTMTGGTISGPGTGDGNGVYSLDAQGGADQFDATSDAGGNPAVINATSIGLQTGAGIIFNVTRGPANPAYDMAVNSRIIDFGGGAHVLTKNGNGILLFTGTNTYIGSTVINGGTLQLGTGQSGQDGSIANTSGVTNNAALIFDLAGTSTAAYPISGTGSLTMDGLGQLVLSGTNTYTGGTFVTNGVVQATNSAAIADNTNLYVGNVPGLVLLGIPAPVVPAPAVSSSVAPVPEPATLALVVAIFTGAAVYRRLRRR
jgi:autotransporter-associated beta strand protein